MSAIRLIVPLLAAAGVSIAAAENLAEGANCGGTPIGHKPTPAIQRLIDAPLKQLGSSRAQIERRLGSPATVVMQEVPNHHEPEVKDRIWTLTYDGLRLKTYEATMGNQEYLFGVVVDRRTTLLALPVQVGDTPAAVVRHFGTPDCAQVESFQYDGESTSSQHHVRFHLKASTVGAIEWIYAIE